MVGFIGSCSNMFHHLGGVPPSMEHGGGVLPCVRKVLGGLRRERDSRTMLRIVLI